MFLGEKVRLVFGTIRYLHDINSIKISSVIGLFDLNISSKNKICDLTDFRFYGHPSAPVSPLNRGFTVSEKLCSNFDWFVNILLVNFISYTEGKQIVQVIKSF